MNTDGRQGKGVPKAGPRTRRGQGTKAASETNSEGAQPLVGVVMGSHSDLPVMEPALALLRSLAVGYEARVLSAHRAPAALATWVDEAEGRGVEVFIAGAGGAAHLPGVVASRTVLPVFGVPVPSAALGGLDALLAIVQMPRGVPVGTLAIGASGAYNAALLAVAVLATSRPLLRQQLRGLREAQEAEVVAQSVIEARPHAPGQASTSSPRAGTPNTRSRPR